MPATFEPIASQTLGTAASTVTFSSIPGTMTDLVLVCSQVGTSAKIGNQVRFNSDSGTNYSNTQVRGVSSAQSNRYSNQTSLFPHSQFESGSNQQTTVVWQIMSYANTSVFKTALCAYSRVDDEVTRAVGLWRSTSAITSIDILSIANTFAVGSTFSLYGIKAAA